MKQPDDRAVRALASLDNDPHFVEVVRWLTEALAEQDRANRTLIGQELHQGQGSAQVLAFMLDQGKESRSNVRRIIAADVTAQRKKIFPATNPY